MNCPACHHKMMGKDFGGVTVDVCADGCGGLWFDWAELVKLDEIGEGSGAALDAALAVTRSGADRAEGPLACPKCGVAMHVHRYDSAREVNVDECYVCGGFFLDPGELGAVRANAMTEAEEAAYTEKLLAELPAWREAQRDLAREKARAEAVRHLTRFVRLSYYMTGR